MTLVYMFPGQNSRYPEMIDRLRIWPGCEPILQRASAALGRNLSQHFHSGNPDMFAHNRDIQVGVFLTSYIMARKLDEEGFSSNASLGLSLGEYNHLVEIGALSFESALRLLAARGSAYQDGPRGLMMSVLPCDASQVAEALAAAASLGQVDISLQLSEKHFVLGGETQAVQAAAAWLEEEAYAQPRVIDAALPMHSRIFRPAAMAFRPALEAADWMAPRQPYLPNIDGHFLWDAGPAVFVDRLHRHVFQTVRWAQSLAEAVARFPEATFVEVGPKRILHNAFRREYKSVKSFCTDDPDSLDALWPATLQQLREIHRAA